MKNTDPIANVYFSYAMSCGHCGVSFNKQQWGVIIHPVETGIFRKRKSECPWAGKRFINPMAVVKLEEY